MARTAGTKTREEMLKMGFHVMAPEQVREYQRLGGKASAAQARRKKLLVEIANVILASKMSREEEIYAALRDGGIDDPDINYAAGIILVQARKAMRGDTRAAEFVRDTSGQKPVDGLQIGNTADLLPEPDTLAALTDGQLRIMIDKKVGEKEGGR